MADAERLNEAEMVIDLSRCEQRVDELTLMLAHVWGCPKEPFACDHELHERATELMSELQGRSNMGRVHWETPTVERQ